MTRQAETDLRKEIFTADQHSFSTIALKVFHFQYLHSSLYRSYCDLLRVDVEIIKDVHKIPFMPIRFFKDHMVTSGVFEAKTIFESSGTTKTINSRHFVKDKSVYEESFLKCFRKFYGEEKDLCIIGLLPSYLERENSSLVYMVQELISRSANKDSGFYLQDFKKLKELLAKNEAAGQPTLLIGVTYALLDFAEQNPMNLVQTIVMETGGMKGRREELTRKQVHDILRRQLHIEYVHSEYGMTELLSQAYSRGSGVFECPPWMQVFIRSEDDPFEVTAAEQLSKPFQSGAVNIIDLANLYSCAFLATDDAGKLYPDGRFEISGRLDNSDIRGCSLLTL